MPIHVPDGFVPNSRTASGPPKLSQQTVQAGSALRRMIYEGYLQKRLCFLMTTAEAMKYDPHINPSHWAPKAGTPEGRNCLNGSNGGKGNQALNSDSLREWARDLWGHIKHPTIEEYVRMVVEFAAAAMMRGEGNRRIRLWKMDISGAYTQLTYRAEDVHLMACSIPGDLVAFFMCGTFGWGAMPFAFHPITQAVVWELNEGPNTKHRLTGRCMMYVDDVAGVCFDDDLEGDQAKTKALTEGLLGKGAISDRKTEADIDGSLDFIGYTVNFRTRRVGISRRNTRRALFAALEVGSGNRVTLQQMQRIASHSARYKRVCPMMAPFVRALYAACCGHTNKNATFPLTEEQMAAVWMMRILLVLATVNAIDHTRSFLSFTLKEQLPTWVIEYDASLEGIAIIWYKREADGSEVALGCFAGSLESMGFRADGSGRMNCAEFIAGTIGVRGLAQHVTGPVAVAVRGDNKAAMTWVERSTFKSAYATRAAIVQVAHRVRSGIEVVDQEHLPHTKAYDSNWRCDKKTRGHEYTWARILEMDKQDPRGSRLDDRMVEWEIDGVDDILALCNPNQSEPIDADFVARVLAAVGGDGSEALGSMVDA